MECTICLCPLSEDLAAIQCGHVFHYSCLKELKKTSASSSKKDERKCPLCRVQITGAVRLFLDLKSHIIDGSSKGKESIKSTRNTLPIEIMPSSDEDEEIDPINCNDEDILLNPDSKQGWRSFECCSCSNINIQKLRELELENATLKTHLRDIEQESVVTVEGLRQQLATVTTEKNYELRTVCYENTTLRDRLSQVSEKFKRNENAVRSLEEEKVRLEAELAATEKIRLMSKVQRLVFELDSRQSIEFIESMEQLEKNQIRLMAAGLAARCREQEKELQDQGDSLQATQISKERLARENSRLKEKLRKVGEESVKIINGESTDKRKAEEIQTEIARTDFNNLARMARQISKEPPASVTNPGPILKTRASSHCVTASNHRAPIVLPPPKFTKSINSFASAPDGLGGTSKIVRTSQGGIFYTM